MVEEMDGRLGRYRVHGRDDLLVSRMEISMVYELVLELARNLEL